MPAFSVIVPVYNKALTLRRSIDSVLSQSFEDWELLLLDDGSKDDSYAIARTFDDSRIRLFHHKNRGVSYTRNRGIQEATGTYIIFLDADDYLENDYLSRFADSIHSCKSDIYLTGITKEGQDGSVQRFAYPYRGQILKAELLESFYKIQRTIGLFGLVASKAIQKDFLLEHGILFDECLKQSEDYDFFLRCYQYCESFCFIKYAGYHYLRYPDGTALHRNDTDFLSLIEVQRKARHFCSGHMSADDEKYYDIIISGFAFSAIHNVPPTKVFSIPSRIDYIRNDEELSKLYPVNKPVGVIMAEAFFNGLRINFSRTILKICRKQHC